MSRVRFRVTEKDISTALLSDPKGGNLASECPIALALKRRMGTPLVVVNPYDCGVFIDEESWTLSAAAGEWGAAFDRGEPVGPATFVVWDD